MKESLVSLLSHGQKSSSLPEQHIVELVLAAQDEFQRIHNVSSSKASIFSQRKNEERGKGFSCYIIGERKTVSALTTTNLHVKQSSQTL